MLTEVIRYLLIALALSLFGAYLIVGNGFYKRCRQTRIFNEADRRVTIRKATTLIALGMLCAMTSLSISLYEWNDLRLLLTPILCAVGTAALIYLVLWVSTANLRRELQLQQQLDRYRKNRRSEKPVDNEGQY